VTHPDRQSHLLQGYTLMRMLSRRLASADSATRVLQEWCRQHAFPLAERVTARRLLVPVPQLPDPLHRELDVRSGEPILHRRVDLLYGTILLCEADNWFLPGRLPPRMCDLLDTTDTPFGHVIADLRPARRTIEIDFHGPCAGTKGQATMEDDHRSWPAHLFEHRAVILTGQQQSVAAVVERYRGELISFALLERGN
jgi:chorismate-pyruvate lyase